MTPASILIRCDGGPVHGFGHVSRCVNLAEALRDAGLGRPVFRTFSPDGAARRFIADRGFAVEDAPGEAGSAGDLASLTDRLAAMPAPRLAVLDSRAIAPAYARSCRALATVLCLDDEDCRELDCDILVNNHAWIGDGDYAPAAHRLLLAGPTYNLLSPSLFRRTPDDTGPVERALITLGGEDPHDHTSWIVRACGDLLAPIAVDIVVGPAHPDPRAVEATLAECLPSARLSVAPSGLEEFILRADLAVSAGGITCYELAAARVPTLAVMVEDHQDALISALERHGSLLRLGGHGDLEAARARHMLASLLGDADRRRRMAAAAGSLFRAPGGAAIAARIAGVMAARQPKPSRIALEQ